MRYGGKWFSASLICLAALIPTRTARALDDPAPCPSPYVPTVNNVRQMVDNLGITRTFTIGSGVFQPLGSIYYTGRYAWDTMTSWDRQAKLTNATSFAHCSVTWIYVPPYAQPQAQINVFDDGGFDGNVIALYTPREEESCGAATNRAAPISKGRIFASLAPSVPSAAKPRFDIGTCSDTTGGSSGGSGTTTTYCLYYDWYDDYGNFLYSELVTCWDEAT